MKNAWQGWKKLDTWVKWVVGVAVFVAVVGIGSAIEGDDEKQPAPAKADKAEPAPNPPHRSMEEVEEELTPALTVDLLETTEPGRVKKMCHGVEVLGPELALAGFKRGYEAPGPNSPNAADVFAEILARC